jgi:hypothetical protein
MKCLYVSVNVIVSKECKYVDEAFWPEHGVLGLHDFPSFARTMSVSFPWCEISANVNTYGRDCIGSSGNVRVVRLAIGLL